MRARFEETSINKPQCEQCEGQHLISKHNVSELCKLFCPSLIK